MFAKRASEYRERLQEGFSQLPVRLARLPRNALDAIFGPASKAKSAAESLKYAEQQLDAVFEARSVDGPRADEGHNLRLVTVCEFLRLRIIRNIQGWRSVQSRPYWFLLEKTPLYWWKYFLYRNVPTPQAELSFKLARLKRLEKNILSFIGAGNRVMTAYGQSEHAGDPKALLQLVHINQHVISLCFQMLLHVDEDETADIAQALKPELFFSPPSDATPEEARALLKANLVQLPRFQAQMATLLRRYGRPPLLVANWLRYSAGAVLFVGSARYLYERRGDIYDWVRDIQISLFNFWKRHLEQPLLDIYRTIRYDTTSFRVMTKDALMADEASLARMIEQYLLQHNPQIAPEEIRAAVEKAQNADIAAIIDVTCVHALRPMYEAAIQKPLKNALFGSLVQLIFIQVQKERVDIERAMLALDKLLRSNELNFQVFALVPAVLFVYAATTGLYRLIYRRMSRRRLFHLLRLEVRAVDRLLNTALPYHPQELKDSVESALNERERRVARREPKKTLALPQYDLSLDCAGRLLVALNSLRTLAQDLNEPVRSQFLEDLCDLESEEQHIHQRIGTVLRMYRTYAFLQPVC